MRVLLFALLVASPSARADEALRARCLELLSAYEEPAKEADWRALGAGADAELLAIAQDSSLSHTRRANAIHALGWFPTEASRAFLVSLAGNEVGDALFRRKAVHALANGWGDGALSELATALASPDVQLRAATARALARVGTPAAEAALRARLPVETDRMVRDAIAAALVTR